MIKSMTGYGRGEVDTERGRFTVEVKSVNSKSRAIVIKLPDTLLPLENRISSYVKSKTSRGQINLSVAFDRGSSDAGKKVTLDRELAREYFELLVSMKEHLSIDSTIELSTIAALSGVVNVEEPEEDIDEIWPSLCSALEMAVDQLIEIRETEGSAILEDLRGRLETMSQLTDRISSRSPEVVEEYRQRLTQRVSDLLRKHVTIDESRMATEVAIMAERCDITEEIVRLRSHISQIKDGLENSAGPVGRHMDFVLQEINREVNTIASKASDVQIAADCIRFKDETEKMREQIQNIE